MSHLPEFVARAFGMRCAIRSGTMLSHRPSVFSLFSALALCACTTNVHVDDDGVGGGSGGSCQDYANEEPSQAVSVTIKNSTTELIYLSSTGCQSTIDLGLKNPAGEPRQWQRSPCGYTCEDFQGPGYSCPENCERPPLIAVSPGGSYVHSWSGALLEPIEMPLSCFHSSELPRNDGTCSQQIVAPAGEYVLIASAWSSISNCESAQCACQPDASGSCQIDDYADVEGEPTKASGKVSYPSATSMVIEFK